MEFSITSKYLIVIVAIFAFATTIKSDKLGENSNITESHVANHSFLNFPSVQENKKVPVIKTVQVQPKTRIRSAKILEEPLESLLEYQPMDTKKAPSPLPLPPIISVFTPERKDESNAEINSNYQQNLHRQSSDIKNANAADAVMNSDLLLESNEKRKLNVKEPNSRQDVDLVSLFTQPQSLKFATVVSPIEASLGGLTGLQGLPPLSFIQFVKMLVALMPFILPMIFIPLLIFTIGVLMLPVTRKNVFFDFGDLRGSSIYNLPSSTHSALLSNYLISPVRKFAGDVVVPRAYQFANEIVNHEECVERISCELSQRYLHYGNWNGDWRSIANKSWISRVLNYLWGHDSTVGRIAKSLDNHQNHNFIKATPNQTVHLKNLNATEVIEQEKELTIGRNRTVQLKTTTNDFGCKRYICQPQSFIKKILA